MIELEDKTMSKQVLKRVSPHTSVWVDKEDKKQTSIEFQPIQAEKTKKEIPFNEYPTTKKVFNSMLDIKRKIHLFTKSLKSKCYHAAGWYILYQGDDPIVTFCPKYIFIQRYKYLGPFKTEDESKKLINI